MAPKSKSKSKGSMISIPSEIITDILYRLPVKSLGRFRCVSKEWLSIISDHKFIKTHLKTINQSHIIFTDGELLYSNPFHPNKSLLTPTEFRLETIVNVHSYSLRGSCDGLVLIYQYFSHEFLVINPTTREFVKLPDSGYHKILNSYNVVYLETNVMEGLGYDSISDDYKVITISYLNITWGARDSVYVHIYSLRTNTWRLLIDSPYNYIFAGHSYRKSVGVFVNGFIHWIAKKRTDRSRVIVAFSLADEKFSEVISPKLCDDVDIISKNDGRLFVFGGKLAIFVEGEVWLMNEYGVKESWTNILVHGLDEILMDKRWEEPMVFDDNGNILVAYKDQMLIYDVGKTTFGKTVYVNSEDLRVEGTFVESLVSPKFRITI